MIYIVIFVHYFLELRKWWVFIWKIYGASLKLVSSIPLFSWRLRRWARAMHCKIINKDFYFKIENHISEKFFCRKRISTYQKQCPSSWHFVLFVFHIVLNLIHTMFGSTGTTGFGAAAPKPSGFSFGSTR